VVDVTLSGVVSELTPTGLIPIEGVGVANGEGLYTETDANGFFSLRPLWVCPCSGEPRVDAGVTSLWVGKSGYQDAPGQASSRFMYYVGPGYRDVLINGDTRVDIRLIRQ
jgi:hypothetical protein